MERVTVEKKILNENDRIAASLRDRFHEQGTLVVNCISSPGSGKTLLLERTLERLPQSMRAAVLTGDIQTDNDARRLARYGFPVQQITTAGACHLDARMIEKALANWPSPELDLLIIENVGNLVCPTSYDLGEECKIVILSVTEGEDKPLKYPGAFHRSRLMVLNKIDLLPYVPFDVAQARANAAAINPAIEIIETSALSGAGIDAWMHWLLARVRARA
ncbi:MAG: hydrogenase nickel incorporation protein HypB [Acidobacteria bacterium]|nr:hydrogenase nickel incorporation protein HypB [Acidobacteriota bacterium]